MAVSFEEPEYTANSDAPGALRVLEAIRIPGLEQKTRFYQASTERAAGAGGVGAGFNADSRAGTLRPVVARTL